MTTVEGIGPAVLAKLAATSLCAALKAIISGPKPTDKEERLIEHINAHPSLLQMLEKAVAHFTPHLASGDLKRAELEAFLQSQELVVTLHDIYATQISEEPVTESLSRVFMATLALYQGIKSEGISSEAKACFDQVIEACDFVLQESIDRGVLAAHEARDLYR